MKNTSVMLFVIGLLLLLGLYIYVDDRLTKMEVRLQGTESAVNTLEPFRRMLAGSTGGNRVSDPYQPVQATGEPNAAGEGRDSAQAWCPLVENGGEEWLRLDYGEEVSATAARVVANYNPGAVVRLETTDPDGAEITLWSGSAGTDGAGFTQDIGFASPRKVRELRVVLDTAAVEGWNEIDAVGLVGVDGKVRWAKSAEASSFWSREAARGEKAEP